MATSDTRRKAGDKTRGAPGTGGRRAKDGGLLTHADPVNRAIGDIRYIRDLMDASQNFFVSGWSGVSGGITTTVGVALTAWIIAHPERWDIPTTLWVLWGIVAAVLTAADVIFYVKGCRDLARPVFSLLLAKISVAEVLMATQGLALTLVFIKTGTPEYIPGAWLLTFGTTLTALGLFIPGGLWVLGLVTFFASIAAFIVPSGGLWCIAFGGASMSLWGAAYLITRGK